MKNGVLQKLEEALITIEKLADKETNKDCSHWYCQACDNINKALQYYRMGKIGEKRHEGNKK